MIPILRVAAMTTGSPARKLVLMTVAALDGATAAQVAAAAELEPDRTRTTLNDLVQAGTLCCTAAGAYTVPGLEDEGWAYSRADDAPAPPVAVPAGVALYGCGHHGPLMTSRGRL